MAARMSSKKPVQKVVGVGIGGAVSTLAIWALNAFVLPADNLITGEVAGAATTVITFFVGYVVPPGAGERVVTD